MAVSTLTLASRTQRSKSLTMSRVDSMYSQAPEHSKKNHISLYKCTFSTIECVCILSMHVCASVHLFHAPSLVQFSCEIAFSSCSSISLSLFSMSSSSTSRTLSFTYRYNTTSYCNVSAIITCKLATQTKPNQTKATQQESLEWMGRLSSPWAPLKYCQCKLLCVCW